MEPVLEENKAALSSLIDQVRTHGIVPLVGAGMSMPYYPVWSKFLLDHAKNSPVHSQIRTLLRQNQYEEAAERLLVTVGDHRFQEIVKVTFGPETLPLFRRRLRRRRQAKA